MYFTVSEWLNSKVDVKVCNIFEPLFEIIKKTLARIINSLYNFYENEHWKKKNFTHEIDYKSSGMNSHPYCDQKNYKMSGNPSGSQVPL